MTYDLTSDQTDLIAHSIRQTYLFDGWSYCPDDEKEAVRSTLVALGYDDPSEES